MTRPVLMAALGLILLPVCSPAAKKKKNQEVTQTLELPKEPPNAVVAETSRLVFHVTPLSSKGLLSQQVRDALKVLLRQTRGATVLKLRAFVAGSGDVRRVQAIVSETFTDRKLPLPALSVFQAGGLPQEGAQVVIESIAQNKKPVNPHGLAFFAGQAASADQPLLPAAPLLDQSLARMRTALAAAGLEARDVVRATCYLSSLEDIAAVRQRVFTEYPGAAIALLQRQRLPLRSVVECEAVARLRTAPRQPVEIVNPPALKGAPPWSQIALIGAPRIALSGSQLAFGSNDADVRLAFQRLGKSLEEVGASLDHVAFVHFYPLSGRVADLIGRIAPEFFDRGSPPAGTMLPFEGLPSLDAAFGVDVIAALPEK